VSLNTLILLGKGFATMTTPSGLGVCHRTLSTGLVASKLFYNTEDSEFFVHFNLNQITVVFCAGCGHGIDVANLPVGKIAEKMVKHWENGADRDNKHPSRNRPGLAELKSFLAGSLGEIVDGGACSKPRAPFFYEQDLDGGVLFPEQVCNSLKRTDIIV